jgi:folylpolyglutamate synthase/dihydrofolate synthase
MSIQLGLQRITALLKHLGSPHLKVPIVHITGTNGKGSVSAYLDSILSSAGLQTGRFNSPHLVDVNDAILVSGKPVDLKQFEATMILVREVDSKFGTQASPFELQTAVAFKMFEGTEPPLDVAIIEVGMGGAEDATNVVPNPLLSIITSIDLDHQAFLGNTVEEIAKVKGGIIKQGCPCLVGPQKHPAVISVLKQISASHGSPFHLLQSCTSHVRDINLQPINAKLSLPGAHQVDNATVAVWAAQVLSERFPMISNIAIKQGLETTKWPGRLDWVRLKLNGQERDVLIDGAHNPSSAETLKAYLDSLPPQDTTFIIDLSSNRTPESILRPLIPSLPGQTALIATTFTLPEGMPWVSFQDPLLIAAAARELGVAQVSTAKTVEEALEQAAQKKESRIVVAGSLYLAADVYRLLRKQGPPFLDNFSVRLLNSLLPG